MSTTPTPIPNVVQTAFDLSGGGLGSGCLTPYWLKMTPTLVTENFCLGGGHLRPVPIQQDTHNVQMISKYGTFHSNFENRFMAA